jgi:hypothetical protein
MTSDPMNIDGSEMQMEIVPVEPSTEPILIQDGSTTEATESLADIWQSFQAKASAFFDNAPKATAAFFKNNQPLLSNLGLLLLAFLGIRVLLAVLDAIDDLPFVAFTLKLIGLVYVVRFVQRYLMRAEDRQELAQTLNRAKTELLGNQG